LGIRVEGEFTAALHDVLETVARRRLAI